MIENQLPQIANLVAKGTLQVSVIYGKKLQGMAIKIRFEQQRIIFANITEKRPVYLKVIQYWKQILKFSFEPKADQKYFSISALGSKMGQIKKRMQIIILDDK